MHQCKDTKTYSQTNPIPDIKQLAKATLYRFEDLLIEQRKTASLARLRAFCAGLQGAERALIREYYPEFFNQK